MYDDVGGFNGNICACTNRDADISLCESVQRGMETPAFTQGRIVNDPSGSGLSEHALHHFHGLVIEAYRGADQ